MNAKNVGNPLIIPVPSEGIKRLTGFIFLNVNSIRKSDPHSYM